mmetsp:Transcript_26242/g.72416  ORF Transcript_26242/g.72416 Transcript_26242/m.72416 type:complete len:200 (-) Transcript_26242:656-1255(-)
MSTTGHCCGARRETSILPLKSPQNAPFCSNTCCILMACCLSRICVSVLPDSLSGAAALGIADAEAGAFSSGTAEPEFSCIGLASGCCVSGPDNTRAFSVGPSGLVCIGATLGCCCCSSVSCPDNVGDVSLGELALTKRAVGRVLKPNAFSMTKRFEKSSRLYQRVESAPSGGLTPSFDSMKLAVSSKPPTAVAAASVGG